MMQTNEPFRTSEDPVIVRSDCDKLALELEGEDCYQSIRISGARGGDVASIWKNCGPFYANNAVRFSFNLATDCGGWGYGEKTIFTFELKVIAEAMGDVIEKRSDDFFCRTINADKEILLKRMRNGRLRFAMLDFGEECPNLFTMEVSEADARKIHWFFAEASRRYRVIGTPTEEEFEARHGGGSFWTLRPPYYFFEGRTIIDDYNDAMKAMGAKSREVTKPNQ